MDELDRREIAHVGPDPRIRVTERPRRAQDAKELARPSQRLSPDQACVRAHSVNLFARQKHLPTRRFRIRCAFVHQSGLGVRLVDLFGARCPQTAQLSDYLTPPPVRRNR